MYLMFAGFKIQHFLYKYIIPSYFLIAAVNAFLRMIGLEKVAKLDNFYFYSVLLVTFVSFVKRIDRAKVFFLFFIAGLFFSSYCEQYSRDCLENALRGQIFCMVFFFIGKDHPQIAEDFFRKGLFPYIVVCIAALGLYIKMPSWYLTMKLMNTTSNWTDGYILEMSRLSGFWPFPYWVSYGGGIFYCYLAAKCYKSMYMNMKIITLMVFLLIILFLAQQRAPLIYSCFVTIYFIVLAVYRNKTRDKYRSYILLFFVLSFVSLYAVSQFMNADMLERMVEKMGKANYSSSFLSERADLFSHFYDKKITFWGDGLGRYSHVALSKGLPAITDHQYLKIVYESGIWGCLGYGLIIIISLIHGALKWRENLFPLTIMGMYIMAMAGANCLAVSEEHAGIFWLCCGLIFAKKENFFEIKKENEKYRTEVFFNI